MMLQSVVSVKRVAQLHVHALLAQARIPLRHAVPIPDLVKMRHGQAHTSCALDAGSAVALPGLAAYAVPSAAAACTLCARRELSRAARASSLRDCKRSTGRPGCARSLTSCADIISVAWPTAAATAVDQGGGVRVCAGAAKWGIMPRMMLPVQISLSATPWRWLAGVQGSLQSCGTGMGPALAVLGPVTRCVRCMCGQRPHAWRMR